MKIGMWTGRLRRSVALGALLSATSAVAFAQQTPPPADGAVETVKPPEEAPSNPDVVTITGSRIAQDSYSSASAMTVVTADDAKVQGVVDIATLLQNSIAASGSSQTTAAISSALAAPPGGLGTQTISLRGLGASRTLVLMNGRRAGPAGTGGSVGPFDLNVIPLSAVERVEILKDGASSLYGSDAVAGVINIITKTDSSSNFDISYTYPEAGAGEELTVSGTWGQEFDQGYFRISADYYHQQEFDRGDRDIFFCGQNYFFNPDGTRADFFDPRTNDYTCRDDVIWGHNWTYDYGGDTTNDDGDPEDANGFNHRPWNNTIGRYQYDYSGVLGQYLLPFNGANPAPSGLINPAGWYPVGYSNIITQAGTDPIFDPYAYNSAALEDFYHPFMNDITLSPEIERMSIVASGEIDLSDSLKAYGEVLLNRRSTREDGYSQIYTFQYLLNYGSGETFGDPIAIDNGWTLRNDPSEYYYVFLSPTAITDHADQKVSVDYMRVVGGLSGDFGPTMPGWTWDFSAQFSRSDGVYKEDIFWVDAITDYELRNSLCEGTLTRYRGVPCVDINWYSPAFNNGELTQEEQDFLYGQTRSRTVYKQTTLEGYMTGNLFSLPAGDVGAVFGFMYQDDSILDRPADPWLDQEVWDGRPSKRGITTGNDDTRAAYVEFQVPVFKDVPLAKEVTLSLSGRYTDVASYGADSTWKAGISWAVTDDFRVRGSQGTSFRAPGLYELYLSEQISSFAQRGDPCAQWQAKLDNKQITQRIADNCRDDPKFPGGIGPTQLSTGGISATVYTSGGYGSLKAETSESRSLGIVWAPEYFGDFQVSIDYFDILVEDQVSQLSNASILYGCYNSPNFPSEPLCDLFTRKQPGELPPGPIKEIFNNYINLASQTSRGVDFEAHYGVAIPWGDLDFTLRAARQLESGLQILPGSAFEDDNGESGEPEWVANLNSSFTSGPWNVVWGLRYVDATSNLDPFTEANPITNNQPYTFLGQPVLYDLSTPPVFYHNLSIGYDFEELGTTARFGVRNVLDETPPMVSSNAGYLRQGNSVIESQYDLYGRTYFVNLSKKF